MPTYLSKYSNIVKSYLTKLWQKTQKLNGIIQIINNSLSYLGFLFGSSIVLFFSHTLFILKDPV